MRIGLTYDLKSDFPARGVAEDEAAEWESEETVAALAETLASLDHDVDRIGHVRRLAARLVAGERWDLVFNMAEGVGGRGRESQVPALLDAFGVPYTFSDAVTHGLTLDKSLAKRIVRDAGVPTPDFAIVETVEDARTIALPPPWFAKPVAEGSSKGITGQSIARSPEDLVNVCAGLLAAYHQPVLVEAFLPGREFTVGILGTDRAARALGVMEIALTDRAEAGVYSRDNKVHYHDRVVYSLLTEPPAEEAAAVALASWRALGGRDGGRVDLRADAQGRVQFLEVNTLPGLDPGHGGPCRALPAPCDLLSGSDCRHRFERMHASVACARDKPRVIPPEFVVSAVPELLYGSRSSSRLAPAYFAAVGLVLGFSDPTGVIWLPVQFTLKDRLAFSPQALAAFEAIVLLPAAIGFVWGWLRDRWQRGGLSDHMALGSGRTRGGWRVPRARQPGRHA